ncbi:hypothetical protein [Streptomyces sp. NPDC002215]|uniref:hypothetical protein n=1 Tax=Streptomyces sp. NPDC002215 TaxID=3154412 RepID=UPI0033318D1B
MDQVSRDGVADAAGDQRQRGHVEFFRPRRARYGKHTATDRSGCCGSGWTCGFVHENGFWLNFCDRGLSIARTARQTWERSAADQPDGRYKGTATATWTVTWTAPALGDGGEFTETRQTAFTAAVGEVQVLN